MSTPADQLAAGNTPGPKVEDPNDPSALEARAAKTEWDEYATAQAFDSPARKQYERDRRYAAGTAATDYAVGANLLGSHVDILVSYLYSRNPKVSVRPAEQVELKYVPPVAPGDPMGMVQRFQDQEARRKRGIERQAFAKTLQIVIGRMWKEGQLKKCMKKVVRSGLSVGAGWFKVVLLFETETDPQVQTALNDLRDNLQRVEALKAEVVTYNDADRPRDELMLELAEAVKGLEAQLEIVLRKTLAIDFVPAEYIQVALDVRDVDDYLEGAWMANALFYTFDDAKAKFGKTDKNPEGVTDEQWKTATKYYQRQPTMYNAIAALATPGGIDNETLGEAYQYTTSQSGAPNPDGAKPVEYVKVVEKWDRRDNLIKTLIEGLRRYGKPPFPPRFATSRFYPYFHVQFFPVDGERHPQSMSWRLSRLQDEYDNSRSSFRLTRQRSIPGVIFNASQIAPDQAKKLQDGTQSEYIPVNLTDPDRPVGDSFAAKPIPTIDPALFDNSLIIGDMEKISGVQEALQTSQTVEKTATQAEIEQGGFAARTTAERDCVEETLSELATYTAELALQGITHKDAQTIAGPLAFWPEQMPLEAITQQLAVDIEAGSTGRPNTDADRETWIAIEPLIERLMGVIVQARATGNEAMAEAYTELLRETCARTDDRLDVDRFVPPIPPMGMMPTVPGAATGGAPGAPGAGGGAPPNAAPGAAAAPSAPGATDPLASAA